MNTGRVYRSIDKIVAAYQVKLDATDEEAFTVTPPIGGWSYSEVYSHIFDASLLSLLALNNASRGVGEIKHTHSLVKLILFFGSFPPTKRYKVPLRLANRVKKIEKLTAQQLIRDFEFQLKKLYPQLAQADPSIKVKHPRMGYLNAEQWLRFIEIHLGHHLKQINRIERSFKQ